MVPSEWMDGKGKLFRLPVPTNSGAPGEQRDKIFELNRSFVLLFEM
jgi:hypothetical protein